MKSSCSTWSDILGLSGGGRGTDRCVTAITDNFTNLMITNKQTYIIVLSEVHPHNIPQGKASLVEKQENVIQGWNVWLTDKVPLI